MRTQEYFDGEHSFFDRVHANFLIIVFVVAESEKEKIVAIWLVTEYTGACSAIQRDATAVATTKTTTIRM